MASPSAASARLVYLFLVGLLQAACGDGRARSLVLQHYPKAGGSTLAYKVFQAIRKQGLLPGAKIRVRTEFDGVQKDDRDKFKIGLIRDPCGLYTSLWAFGVRGGTLGDFSRYIFKKAPEEYDRLYGAKTGVGETDKARYTNITKFRAWLRNVTDDDMQRGVASIRFWSNYIGGGHPGMPNLGKKSLFEHIRIHKDLLDYWKRHTRFSGKQVDCWVHTETLISDFRTCLVQFEKWVGENFIRWEELDLLLQLASNKLVINKSPHLPCKAYFDAKSVNRVLEKDPELLRMWNFTCCDTLRWEGDRPVVVVP